MDVGEDMIGMVKTNQTLSYKDTIENLTKDCPGGSYLVFKIKSLVIEDRQIIAISYKYNTREVIYFVATKDTGIKIYSIEFLLNYPNLFDDVAILPVALLLLCISYLDMLLRLNPKTKYS